MSWFLAYSEVKVLGKVLNVNACSFSTDNQSPRLAMPR